MFQSLICEWLVDVNLWITRGELRDSINNFFVNIQSLEESKKKLYIHSAIDEQHGHDNGSRHHCRQNIWSNKYIMNETMIPEFISLDKAEKIFITGKCIAYIRALNVNYSTREEISFSSTNLVSNGFEELHKYVDTIYSDSVKKIFDLLIKQHGLLRHCKILRRYILLVCGEFANAFIGNNFLHLHSHRRPHFHYHSRHHHHFHPCPTPIFY
jgi:hypothetical protein